MAQSIKCPTLGLGSGHDLKVQEFEPHIGLCADGESLGFDSLSLKINNFKKMLQIYLKLPHVLPNSTCPSEGNRLFEIWFPLLLPIFIHY